MPVKGPRRATQALDGPSIHPAPKGRQSKEAVIPQALTRQRTPEMQAWIDKQLKNAPKRDDVWTADLLRIYGLRAKQKGRP